MSENFIAKNSPTLDKIVNDATTQGEDIGAAYERLKAELHGALHMTIAPPSQNDILYGRSPLPDADAPLPPSEYRSGQHTHERIIYPHGNDRYVVTGFSNEEVEQKIARIMKMYGE